MECGHAEEMLLVWFLKENCFLLLRIAECEKLMELYERLEELDADKAAVRASRILHGLGFSAAMQQKKLKDFSGGWRMRVALARYRPACSSQ